LDVKLVFYFYRAVEFEAEC